MKWPESIATLDRLAHRDPSLVQILPRQPGTKESRYAHLFSGAVDVSVAQAPSPTIAGGKSMAERVAALEEEVASLRTDFQEMQQQLATFRKQFE